MNVAWSINTDSFSSCPLILPSPLHWSFLSFSFPVSRHMLRYSTDQSNNVVTPSQTIDLCTPFHIILLAFHRTKRKQEGKGVKCHIAAINEEEKRLMEKFDAWPFLSFFLFSITLVTRRDGWNGDWENQCVLAQHPVRVPAMSLLIIPEGNGSNPLFYLRHMLRLFKNSMSTPGPSNV